jgi:hypothetical protein
MNNKLRRLSYNQLVVLGSFLSASKKVLEVKVLEGKSGLKGKSLGGVLSSLARTKFRGVSLIEPVGRALDGQGLRWQLNDNILDVNKAKEEVSSLLKTYE